MSETKSAEARYTAIYLQDHHAGSTVGLELTRRALSSNPEGELGEFLRWLENELIDERSQLEAMMSAIGVKPDRLKDAGGWIGEKLGRFKLNGQITGYSPLSRLVELEGLHVGISGKLSMWENLRSAHGASFAGHDLDELARRAEEQRARLAEHRAAAARASLG